MLLVVVIVILLGFGYWGYTRYYKAGAPAEDNGSINVDINLPSGEDNADGASTQ